ncbi:MAG TPA: ABC transporter substrate-binding protein [Nitrosopumilaceae archaeon]|nr:ABC transporter substrate-binding protein [Nitrosopumilaceae archaeon]
MSKNKIIASLVLVSVVIGIIVFTVPFDSPSPELTANVSSLTNNTSSSLTGIVQIGGLFPLTGSLSNLGEDSRAGAHLAVIDFNEHLEKLDSAWELDMITEDSGTSPTITFEKITSLKAKNTNIVLGPASSAEVSYVKGYADSNNMLMISYGSSATALSIPNDNLYRLAPDTTEQGNAIANIIYSEGITTLIPIWRGDVWGDGLHDSIFSEFTRIGGTVDEGIRYFPDTTEFPIETSFLEQRVQHHLDSMDAEKIGVLIIGFQEYVQIIYSASEYDALDDVRWFGSPGITETSQMVTDPTLKEFSEKTQFTAVQFGASYSSEYDKVKKRIELEIGRPAGIYAFSAYDSVWIFGLAMLETQSDDVSIVKGKIPEIAENYSGVIGSTKLNNAGDLATANYDIVGIKNNQWFLVGTYNATSGIVSNSDK